MTDELSRPIPPNEPGALPVSVAPADLKLVFPHFCVCCLEPAATTLPVVTVAAKEAYRYYVPACADCVRHAESVETREWGIAVAVVLPAVTVLGALLILLSDAGGEILVGGPVVTALLFGTVAFAIARASTPQREGCVTRGRPVEGFFRDGRLHFQFANRAWGERFAELNG